MADQTPLELDTIRAQLTERDAEIQKTRIVLGEHALELLEARTEIERLRALVGEEGQPGWDGIDRAGAIRQAEEAHAGRLQWIQRFDALRDQRDAEIERLRARIDAAKAVIDHWCGGAEYAGSSLIGIQVYAALGLEPIRRAATVPLTDLIGLWSDAGATGATETARQGVSAPRSRDNGTRATESTPDSLGSSQTGEADLCTSRHTNGHAVAQCQQPAGHEQHTAGPRTWYSGDGDELLDTLTPFGRRIHAAIDLFMYLRRRGDRPVSEHGHESTCDTSGEGFWLCTNGALYGPCEDDQCGGTCSYRGECDCWCHGRDEGTDW